ncbi:MAG: LLM class flavin-dependent oxidoreductase [Chloroflexi bacterium]|nr:LLM class flavin-dependent oxidoreductase [Chloroflexota bacterium]
MPSLPPVTIATRPARPRSMPASRPRASPNRRGRRGYRDAASDRLSGTPGAAVPRERSGGGDAVEIGLGLDASLGMTFDDQATLAREAAELGYMNLWTPEGIGLDSFQLCLLRWQATRAVVPEGLVTGIGVSNVAYRSPTAFAISAGTLGALTGGRFVLGIGSGRTYSASLRRALGLGGRSALVIMREYLVTMRALLAGETVDHEGDAVTLRGVQLGIAPPPRTPVYLAALGPEMLRLAGEVSDGAALNWCSAEQVAWSRERLNEGAAKAGRDPSAVQMAEYIRICVDEDVACARRGLARATMGYALGQQVPTERERRLGYRGHFERMGFADELGELDRMRERGAKQDELLDAFPDEILQAVGYYGPAGGAAEAFARLAHGLDTAIVRVVASRPGLDSVRAVMRACRPERVLAAAG